MKKNKTSFFIHMIFILFSVLCVIPFMMVISASFTSSTDLAFNGFSILPSKIDLTAYAYLFENPKQIINSYVVTFFITISNSCLCDNSITAREHIRTLDEKVHFDCLVHLGDILRGNNPEKVSSLILRQELDAYRNALGNGKLFVVQGEQDGYRDEAFCGQLVVTLCGMISGMRILHLLMRTKMYREKVMRLIIMWIFHNIVLV